MLIDVGVCGGVWHRKFESSHMRRWRIRKIADQRPARSVFQQIPEGVRGLPHALGDCRRERIDTTRPVTFVECRALCIEPGIELVRHRAGGGPVDDRKYDDGGATK
jgi:hypothetical protein